jgi:hypothetical protein
MSMQSRKTASSGFSVCAADGFIVPGKKCDELCVPQSRWCRFHGGNPRCSSLGCDAAPKPPANCCYNHACPEVRDDMNHVAEIQQLMGKLNTSTPDLQELDAELAEDPRFKLFLKATKASVLYRVKLPPATADRKQKELHAAMLMRELMWHSQSMEQKAKWVKPESSEKRAAKKKKVAQHAENNNSREAEDEPELDNNPAANNGAQGNSAGATAAAVTSAAAAAAAAAVAAGAAGGGSGNQAVAFNTAAAAVAPLVAEPVLLEVAPVVQAAAAAGGAGAASGAAAADDVPAAAGTSNLSNI